MVGLVLLSLFVLSVTPLGAQREAGELDSARLLAMDGQYEEAVSLFLRLLEDEPEDAELHYYTGLCYFFLKDSRKSIFFLEEAVENGAEFPEAYYWLGQSYLQDRKFDEALRAASEGLELFPRNEKLRYLFQYSRGAREDGHRPAIKTDPGPLTVPAQPPVSGKAIDDLH